RLAPVADQNIDEGQKLSFRLSASDPDLINDGSGNYLTQPLTYSASNLPRGAAFDSSTGAFAWVPGEDQDGQYRVTFTVSDGALTDSQTVLLDVADVNAASKLAVVDVQHVDEGQRLSFRLSASDPDLVDEGSNNHLAQPLTYSVSNLP